MRDSFVFYRSFYESIKELDPLIQAEIYNAIFEYSLNFNLVELTGISKSIFTLIKPQIDANNKKYQNGKLGAEHGNKGGRPKKNPTETPNKPQENPIETPNVNENENENDIYINSENLTDTDKQLNAFNQILNNNPDIKKEYEELPNQLLIDNDYYKAFIEKWNGYVFRYTDRKVGITSLQPLDKQNLKTINLPLEEISKAMFSLFNQKDIIESCLITPKHLLNEFAKYYQAGLEFEKTNNIIQFYKQKNN